MVSILLSNLSLIQLGLEVQHPKGAVDSRFKKAVPFSQVVFDFPFELSAIYGMHLSGLLLLVFVVKSMS
jgi:hypothetical protein